MFLAFALLFSVALPLFLGYGVWRSDPEKEPWRMVLLTWFLGVSFAAISLIVAGALADLLELDASASFSSETDRFASTIFLFALMAPLFEIAKLGAVWPAFRSIHFNEAYDGVVYTSWSALAFSAVQNAFMLASHPRQGLWYLRALLSLFANLFFSCAWGYALGLAKSKERPGPIFPFAWLFSTLMHGIYMHLVLGRGPGALAGVLPFLLVMGVFSFFAGRDLLSREWTKDRHFSHGGRASLASTVESLRQNLKEARRSRPRPHYIFYGALVVLGSIFAAFAFAVFLGHLLSLDFAAVSERDMSSVGPVAVILAMVLLAFPVSSFVLARTWRARSVTEPALSTMAAMLISFSLMGIAVPTALLYGLALFPVALTLACAGAWIGREK